MTRPAPFTEAALRRAIRAAEKAGYRVGGVKPDGTVLVYDGEKTRPDVLNPGAAGHDAEASEWEVFKA